MTSFQKIAIYVKDLGQKYGRLTCFEELVNGVIEGAKKAGTVVTEVGTGKFSSNIIKVFNHNGVKVAVDESRKLIMSIRPEKDFYYHKM